MRRTVVGGGQLRFIYPDEVCFAFNPNYLEIDSRGIPTLTIQVGVKCGESIVRKHSVIVSVYDTKASVYLSRLFTLLFEEPENTRSLLVNVQVLSGGTSKFSFDTVVIWGSLAPGERFNSYGVFEENGEHFFERNLIWYKNFPFSVSVFKYDHNVSFQSRIDGGLFGGSFYAERPAYSINEIDEFSTPTIVDDLFPESTNGTLAYFPSTRQILIGGPGYGQWYRTWGEYENRASSLEMIGEDNSPKKDIDYILTDREGMQWCYRFDGSQLKNCGLVQSIGYTILNPCELFPNAKRNVTIRYKIGNENNLISTFDSTFDSTFSEGGHNIAIINLSISNETAGHYMRWVDSQGNLQYFLFKKGKRTAKTKLSSNSIAIDTYLRGMQFPNMQRLTNVELTVTHKCAAMFLPSHMFGWVSSILTSPIIDMYLGKDFDGNEIWVPVTIQSATADYDNKQELHDLEITFRAPAYTAQSL